METIKSLECASEKYIEQSNQKEKDYNELKNDLKRERENNDDMEDILEKRDNEINQLNENIKAKNKDLESLELFVKQRVEEINNLRENNISMGNQLLDVIKLEKKVSIQDNSKLQEENREKVKLVESMNIEKESFLEKIKVLEEKSTVLENVAIDEEFQHLATQPFKCDKCAKTFNT